jgi:hypothetical protein
MFKAATFNQAIQVRKPKGASVLRQIMKRQKLPRDQWTLLDNMMQHVPDPNETFTNTGWHYNLAGLLGSFGIRTGDRYDTFKVGKQLWDRGWADD